MKGQVDIGTQWVPFSKESADATALTVTLTPASGEHVAIKKLSVSFDDAIVGPLAFEIKVNAVSKWKDYLYLTSRAQASDAALGTNPYVLDFDPAFGTGVADHAITIHVAAAPAGIKSRVSGLMCSGVAQT